MRNQDINIRDPFILPENGKYYMYGTRAASFGFGTAGFDVYVSDDLETWSDPIAVFDSAACGMNDGVNWAPEVHKYHGKYYLFATFPYSFNHLQIIKECDDGNLSFTQCFFCSRTITPHYLVTIWIMR